MTTHDDVAHNWAHQTGRRQRGFNMYYDGDTIYSYGRHFPIARLTATRNGAPCALLTTASYSVSTAKHITITRRAIPGSVQMFEVDNVTAIYKDEHRANHAGMVAGMRAALDKASRARQNKAYWLTCAETLREQANRYARAFRLGLRSIEQIVDIAAALEVERKAKVARDRKAIRKWLDGEADRAPNTRTPYLRVVGDVLETSWGVRVPVREALPVFRLARKCAKRGAAFEPVKDHRVGTWRIDEIKACGTIKAGCHIIPLGVQMEAAKRAGLVG